MPAKKIDPGLAAEVAQALLDCAERGTRPTDLDYQRARELLEQATPKKRGVKRRIKEGRQLERLMEYIDARVAEGVSLRAAALKAASFRTPIVKGEQVLSKDGVLYPLAVESIEKQYKSWLHDRRTIK